MTKQATTFRLSAELRPKLIELARAEGHTVSSLVGRAVQEFLDRNGMPSDQAPCKKLSDLRQPMQLAATLAALDYVIGQSGGSGIGTLNLLRDQRAEGEARQIAEILVALEERLQG